MSTATVEIPTHQQVLTFVSKPWKMLIGGKWLEAASGKTFPTYNPATGETLAHVAEGNSDVARRTASRPNCAQGRCGSSATTSSTLRCLSADTSNPGGAAKWAMTRWNCMPR